MHIRIKFNLSELSHAFSLYRALSLSPLYLKSALCQSQPLVLAHCLSIFISSLQKISGSILESLRRQAYPSEMKDFIVQDVRRTIFRTISTFEGCLKEESEMARLIDLQIAALREDFRVANDVPDVIKAVAFKLLYLYRTGRLGRYTLEHLHP